MGPSCGERYPCSVEAWPICVVALAAAAAGEVYGNRKSKVYRVPGCKDYASMATASLVPFATEAAAQQAGYHRAKTCP